MPSKYPSPKLECRFKQGKTMVDKKELDAIANLAMKEVPNYIQSIVIRKKDDSLNLATCTYVEIRSKVVAVTCAHVVKSASQVWTGLPISEQSRITEKDIKKSTASKIISSDDSIDLTLIEGTKIEFDSINKKAYNFEKSDNISLESTLKNLNTFSCFCGLWGKKAAVAPYEDGVVYAEFPLYFAFGPIRSVQESLIICDFAEQEQIINNTDKFSQLKDMKLTGGGRDLSGTSGSGLWIHNGENFLLIGILLGPEPSKKDEQLIRFTPVWKLRDFLNSIQI